jgi:hypothetical protein
MANGSLVVTALPKRIFPVSSHMLSPVWPGQKWVSLRRIRLSRHLRLGWRQLRPSRPRSCREPFIVIPGSNFIQLGWQFYINLISGGKLAGNDDLLNFVRAAVNVNSACLTAAFRFGHQLLVIDTETVDHLAVADEARAKRVIGCAFAARGDVFSWFRIPGTTSCFSQHHRVVRSGFPRPIRCAAC